jgi:hypothetical protein
VCLIVCCQNPIQVFDKPVIRPLDNRIGSTMNWFSFRCVQPARRRNIFVRDDIL